MAYDRVKDCGVKLIITGKHKIQLRVNLVFILYWNSVYSYQYVIFGSNLFPHLLCKQVTFVYTCCVNIRLIFILIPTYVE
jgi:hypothetical protein